ncbi:MarR family winged helix-turn-helix transcriptional regulator [Bifidobacterium favimelis]|uniref:MarR family transcriptional regulator n=1 Tax=Bifidobacterium favimelis TaxID=3122979 RepID=A0ABU8ZR25_9BIFI
MSDFPSEYGQNASGSVGLSFIRVYNLWHKQVKDALKGIGLTHPQYVVLASLGYLAQQGNEINQVDIARNSDIDVMTVSTILRNLERGGLVTRRTAPDDQRAKTVTMTHAGRSILKRALPLVEGIDADFFGALGRDEAAFNTMLLKLTVDR